MTRGNPAAGTAGIVNDNDILKSPERPSLKSLRVRKCQVNRQQPVVTHPNKTHNRLKLCMDKILFVYCSLFVCFFPKLTLAVLQVLQVAVSA